MDKIYQLLKRSRWRRIEKFLDRDSKTLLDIGSQDLFFYNKLKDKYEVTLTDYSPKFDIIKKENVQNLSFKENSFDIVLCQEVLEHVLDPIKAIQELRRVTKKQLIITIPNEPFFTLFRFFIWDKEHLWAISPKVFYHYLGKPKIEKKVIFKRYYFAVWEFD